MTLSSTRTMCSLALLVSVCAAFTATPRRLPVAPRRTVQKTAPPRMLFLMEAPFKADALQWAKETSRTQRAPKCAVVALYDDQRACVYVGAFDDLALAVASLCIKHGRDVVNGLRQEEFPAEVFADDEGRRMMDGLVGAWVGEATEDNNGVAPYGNAEAGWADFDKTANPFLAGYLGAEGEGIAALLTEEELAEEKLQNRKENMKKQLDEAVLSGDETLARKLIRRIGKMDDGLEVPDDDDDDLA